MLASGTRVGPYEVVSWLGAGGMGEVYRARDTTLGRDVALKTLPEELARQPDRLARLKQEARILASLNHPGIATLHGLEDGSGGVPVLVMELVEGETLAERLRRGPLPQREALTIAHQVAAALEAAHAGGVLHRDLKPANVHLTRDGRVKLLDFGLAKALLGSQLDSGFSTESGAVVGTASYMSPEQAQGKELDRRSDVWAFGCLLFELLSGQKAFGASSPSGAVAAVLTREPDWEALPPETPVAVHRLLERCLQKDRERRLRDMGDACLELAEHVGPVARPRREGTGPRPYPGLSAFTEEDAENLFGREAEIEIVWEKVRRRTLLGLIGSSGAGKTSFLRAGVLPRRPEGWAAIFATPGASPFLSLAHAVAAELAGDAEGVRELLRFEKPEAALSAFTRWRKRKAGTLIILDQFEELFTLNPRSVQERFTALLGRLASEADIHVVISLRDDFLMRCHDHAALAPIFDALLPLKAPEGEALRRALVEPAARQGVSFEDEALAAEMLEAVSGERGALPLLAFAASRLWEERDRDRRLLTRAAYERIGGVAGALARHAEATLDRVGTERTALVRELFRNLVTAQGTRAAREREELLSVFPEPERAEARVVLDTLVDARLLTQYERQDASGESRPHLEIVHESLLTHWPRLVRWQTQDADGAQLREQLRQAASLWEEKGRPDDLLWSGSSYREFALWRERYAGGLTATETAFAEAATKRAQRARRTRRLAVAALLAVAFAVAAITFALWWRARTQALRAEASELLALGRLDLVDRPTRALAFVIASLERSDTPEARRFARQALLQGAAAFVLPAPSGSEAFSPDGRWLATGSLEGVRLWSRDGGAPTSLQGTAGSSVMRFGPHSDRLVVKSQGSERRTMRILSVPDAREIRRIDFDTPFYTAHRRGTRVVTFGKAARGVTVQSWPIGPGEPEVFGEWDDRDDMRDYSVSADGEWLAWARGPTVYLQSLRTLKTPRPRVLGTHPAPLWWVSFEGDSERLVSGDEGKEIRIWPPLGDAHARARTIPARFTKPVLAMSADGSTLVGARDGPHPTSEVASVWDLGGPPDAEPVVLRNGDARFLHSFSMDRSARWLAASLNDFAALWPLPRRQPRILRGQPPPFVRVAFTPDGRWLASTGGGGAIRLWPLSPSAGSGRRMLLEGKSESVWGLRPGPTGRELLVATWPEKAFVVPLDGGEPQVLPRLHAGLLGDLALSADGRQAAAGSAFRGKENLIEVWDLPSRKVRSLDPRVAGESCGWGKEQEGAVWAAQFTSDGRLLTTGVTGLRLWNLDEGTSVSLRPCRVPHSRASLAGSSVDRFLLVEFNETQRSSMVTVHDLRSGTSRELTSHGSRVDAVALDPTGQIAVTGDFDGIVRVGPTSGEEPHLLYGHELEVTSVAVSPDGRWIASGSQDGTIRLWPMPQGMPFHTLPSETLLARLRSLTNLRVVRDADVAIGYRAVAGAFPGWASVPEW
jgi:WD40 repeat protein